MPTTLVIRPVMATDLPAIGDLIGELGYSARRDGLLATLGPMLEDRKNILLKGLADDLGMVAFQYAKGLASERGWVRLESVVARERESHRRGFLLARGFVQADRVTYRWGLLEGRHPASPALDRETREGELV
jgi:hypothetical protein